MSNYTIKNLQFFEDVIPTMINEIDDLIKSKLCVSRRPINILLTGGNSLTEIFTSLCQMEQKYNDRNILIRVWLTDERQCRKMGIEQNYQVCKEILNKFIGSKIKIIKWNYLGRNILSLLISCYIYLFKYLLCTVMNSTYISILTLGSDGHFAGYWRDCKNFYVIGKMMLCTVSAPNLCSHRVSFSPKIFFKVTNNFMYLNTKEKANRFEQLFFFLKSNFKTLNVYKSELE